MVMPKLRKKFSLNSFWASLRLPFLEVGGEWKRKPVPNHNPPNRKAIEARIRKELKAEQDVSSTPLEEMLREINHEATRRFQKALKSGEPVEIGVYGLIQTITANEIQRKRQS